MEKIFDGVAEKHVITLHIPDDYEFKQEELIDELDAKIWPHLPYAAD